MNGQTEEVLREKQVADDSMEGLRLFIHGDYAKALELYKNVTLLIERIKEQEELKREWNQMQLEKVEKAFSSMVDARMVDEQAYAQAEADAR